MAMINSDTLESISSSESIFSLDGSDILSGLKCLDHLDGGDGNDVLRSVSRSDYLLGRNDNDNLASSDDADRPIGDDVLFGGAGGDTPKGDNQDVIDSLDARAFAAIDRTEFFKFDDVPEGRGGEIIYLNNQGTDTYDVV